MSSRQRRISVRQLAFVQLVAISPSTLIYLPGLVLKATGHDAPYAIVGAACLASGLNWVVASIVGQERLPVMVRTGFGRLFGRLLWGIYGLALFFGLTAVWSEFLSFVRSSVLPRTPEWALGAIALAVVLSLAYGRVEGVARVSDLLVPVLLIVLGGMTMASLMVMAPNNLRPWYPLHPIALVKGVWLPLTFFGESVVVAPLVGAVRGRTPSTVRRAILAGTILSELLLLLVVVAALGILGTPYASITPNPFFEVIKDLRVGKFLSRADLFFVPIWTTLIYLKLSIWTVSMGEASRFAARRGPVWLWQLLGTGGPLVLSIVWLRSSAERILYVKVVWGLYVFPSLLGFVFVVGFVYWLKKRQQERRNHGHAVF